MAVEDEAEDAWISELLPNLMALILYMVIIMSSSVLVMAMTDEKKNRVIELLVSSVSTRQLITGKIIAVGILGLMIMLLWLVIIWSVAKFGGQPLAIPENFSLPTALLGWAFIYGMFGFAIYGAQMAGLGALAPDIKDSRSISFVIMIPLIAVYMFLIAIIAKPDGPIAIVLSLFPLTSPVGMITRMTVTDVPTWQAVLAAILQLLGAIVIVRIVIRLFHTQILLSGQPISVKRYFGVLLGGK
jgi:ABC-2 type transport system permease protein